MFNEISNIITETFNYKNYSSNRYIGTTNKCNVYWSYPHFEDQLKSRYFEYSPTDVKEKIFRSLKEFNICRIFRTNK
jgi:hypothetical protein